MSEHPNAIIIYAEAVAARRERMRGRVEGLLMAMTDEERARALQALMKFQKRARASAIRGGKDG